MNWLYFAAAAWLTMGTLLNIASIGKKREPVTGGVVAFATVISAWLIALLIIAGINA